MLGKEQFNFIRLSCAIIDVLSQILRDLLTQNLPPNQFPSQNKKKIDSLKLTVDQLKIVQGFPNNDYRECDISILYKFLRNLCPLIPMPTKGWRMDMMPQSSHITLGDDIQRIRLIRNMALGHLATTKIPDVDYNYYWDIVKDICKRLQLHFGNKHTTNFVFELETIECCKFEEKIPEYYSKSLDKTVYSETNLAELKDDLENITNTVNFPQLLQQEMQSKLKDLEKKEHFQYTIGEFTREASDVVNSRQNDALNHEKYLASLRDMFILFCP